jgi:tight adherence protein C
VSTLVAPLMFGSASAIVVAALPWRRAMTRSASGSGRVVRVQHSLGPGAVREDAARIAHLQSALLALSVLGVALIAVTTRSVSTAIIGAIAAYSMWRLPLLFGQLKERERQRAVDVELVDALGEMVMGVEAGLTLEAVVHRYTSSHETGLSREFAHVLERIRVGDSRDEAFGSLAVRTPTPGVRTFTSAVRQNQRLGTPLGATLRQQAETARRRRRQLVEERAARISMKMIFPTVFCILPALLVVIVGPSVIRLIEALP